jgi:hypothetical protein
MRGNFRRHDVDELVRVIARQQGIAMYAKSPLINFWHSLHHIASHTVITLIAVAVAFSLPKAATYILFTWWPRMQEDGRGLLYTEIAFAALLVLVMNLVKLAWDYRGRARISDVASLVFAQESGDWLTRWVKDNQMKRMPWKRDLTIKAVTGYGTFAADDSALKTILDDCYELRVMLLDPYGPSALAYAAAHADPQTTLIDMRREVAASIAALKRLQGPGKTIALKFYDEAPFWKLVFIGHHVWVRCCQGTRDTAKFPEYVFALQPDKPMRGFFPAFYTDFLNQWSDPRHPEYLFDSDELLYRNGTGGEARRVPYRRGEDDVIDAAPESAILFLPA